MRHYYAIFLVLPLAVACGDGERELTRDELLTAAACERCHPNHYVEWLGSSHAFAADDPVFLAMNAKYQRDTGGANPQECIRCHAPVALAEGATTDGLNLTDVPEHLRGVTCYACHAVADANPVTKVFTLADDGVMLGAIKNDVKTGAHASEYSTLLDRNEWRSTDLCGACHEFDNASGAHPHRTYSEWTDSLFANTFERLFLTCGGCHTKGRPDVVATGDVPTRRHHAHTFPGVNVALMDWPEKAVQLDAINTDLASTLNTRICLEVDTWRPEISLDNVMGGHMWPSGDAFTRRAWVELIARKDGEIIYQSGVVPDGVPVTSTLDDDPGLWLLRDRLTDSDDQEVLFPWLAVNRESELLPPAVTTDPLDPRYYHAVYRLYPPLPQVPDTIDLQVHIRPIALEILDELIASGDLDPAVRDLVPTFTLSGSVQQWSGEPGSCSPK